MLDVLTQLVPLIFYIAFLYALHPDDKEKDKNINTFHEENEMENQKKEIPTFFNEASKSDIRSIELRK